MITKKKLSYEGPVCEVFEVQLEAVMLENSPGSASRGYNGLGNDLGDLTDE